MSELSHLKNKSYKALIKGKLCQGIIQVENDIVYLCQNEIAGLACKDKLGYAYSWQYYSMKDGYTPSVAKFQLIEEPTIKPVNQDISKYKDWKVDDILVDEVGSIGVVIFRSGKLVVLEQSNGKASSNYTCDELYELGYRLYIEPDSVQPKEAINVSFDDLLTLYSATTNIPINQINIIP